MIKFPLRSMNHDSSLIFAVVKTIACVPNITICCVVIGGSGGGGGGDHPLLGPIFHFHVGLGEKWPQQQVGIGGFKGVTPGYAGRRVCCQNFQKICIKLRKFYRGRPLDLPMDTSQWRIRISQRGRQLPKKE